jgi:ABC-2 type transport system permease protein
MNPSTTYFRDDIRIVWAITLKDITETLKNKVTLGVLLPVLFILVFYRMLPSLLKDDPGPNFLVYDAGEASLTAALEESGQVNLYDYPDREMMLEQLADGDSPELGLLIPQDFDQRLGSGEELEFEGYVLHWVSPTEVTELLRFAELHISELAGAPVQINLTTIHPQPDSFGLFLPSMGIIFVLFLVGVSLVPNIMIEEKQNKTIDALLISPAKPEHMIIGKALTGLFYAMLCMGLWLVLNANLVTHWWLTILVGLCAALFGVSIGLLLGTIFEVRQQLQLWAWLIFVPLFVPVMLVILSDILPPALVSVLHWTPTVALFDALRLSYTESTPWTGFVPQLALVLAITLALLALGAWIIRRSDR